MIVVRIVNTFVPLLKRGDVSAAYEQLASLPSADLVDTAWSALMRIKDISLYPLVEKIGALLVNAVGQAELEQRIRQSWGHAPWRFRMNASHLIRRPALISTEVAFELYFNPHTGELDRGLILGSLLHTASTRSIEERVIGLLADYGRGPWPDEPTRRERERWVEGWTKQLRAQLRQRRSLIGRAQQLARWLHLASASSR